MRGARRWHNEPAFGGTFELPALKLSTAAAEKTKWQ
jgi:hypothetical protein